MIKGMRTCKICGRDFPLICEEHYIGVDPRLTGLSALCNISGPQKQYDAIDCPHCGCQNVLQERKSCNSFLIVDEEEDEKEEEEDE